MGFEFISEKFFAHSLKQIINFDFFKIIFFAQNVPLDGIVEISFNSINQEVPAENPRKIMNSLLIFRRSLFCPKRSSGKVKLSFDNTNNNFTRIFYNGSNLVLVFKKI